jgi:small-conductance mechanosensitive channel
MRDLIQVLLEEAHAGAVRYRLLASIIIIFILVVVRAFIGRLIRHRAPDPRTGYHWNKAATYTLVTIGVLLIGREWFEGFRSIATVLGLIGAGIALALRDFIANLAGWIYIFFRRPFGMGDRIQIGTIAGDVIDQRIFQFTVLEIGNWVDADQSTGRLVHIPNMKVLSEPLANYTRGFGYLWNELRVPVTFESDWERAKALLLEIVQRHASAFTRETEEQILESSGRFLIFYSTLAPTVYTSVDENGVVLTIRYLCEPRRRRGTSQAIWEDVLREFGKEPDIAFAHPTIRYFHNAEDGKDGVRGVAPGAPERRGGG